MEVAASPRKIQEEEVRYKGAVSEATLTKIAGSINYLLNAFFPVGSIIPTALTEVQFQDQIGSEFGNWVLADGRDVTSSAFETITGNSDIPDLRGRYPRGKDNGASLTPEGDVDLGTELGHMLQAHTHTHTYYREDPPYNSTRHRWQKGPGDNTLTTETNNTGNTGTFGAETRPVSTVVNFMIRID